MLGIMGVGDHLKLELLPGKDLEADVLTFEGCDGAGNMLRCRRCPVGMFNTLVQLSLLTNAAIACPQTC